MLESGISKSIRMISILIVFLLISISAQAQYSGGSGEPNDPYEITTAGDWVELMNTSSDWDKNFILTADINLQGISLSPVGNFTGLFDGNAHIISNVEINIPYGNGVGLFGVLGTNGQINNLFVTNVDITGNLKVGGLVGNNYGFISNSYSTGSVSGEFQITQVGGLVGYNGGFILNSNSDCSVTGKTYVGGLVGDNRDSVSNSYSTGQVTGGSNVGGLIGNNFYSIVNQCYCTGAVNGTGDSVGGLVGFNSSGSVSNSFSTGSVGGSRFVGGLVGHNDGNVIQCYSRGSVTKGRIVGGLVGGNDGSVSNSYSTGSVSGTSSVGGLVGSDWGTVSSSFWDETTSGCDRSDGGTGKTTDEIQDPNTFLLAGWDFLNEQENGICDIWLMSVETGYPQFSVLNGYIPELLNGSGSMDDPYIIETPEDLSTVWYRPTACYQLESDIDLDGSIWPAAIIPAFTGSFDGQEHKIRNMTVFGNGYLGLFGFLAHSASISDLDIDNVNIIGTGDYVGGLVGYNYKATLTRCFSTGQINSAGDLGGLAGYNDEGTIAQCYSGIAANNTGEISMCGIGGLVGNNWYGIITQSCSTGNLNGEDYVGGLVGMNSSGSVSNSYSTCSITDGRYVGGLVGWNIGGSISKSYSTGSVDGGGFMSEVGGLVGMNSGTDSKSFWDTTTSGRNTSGGGTGKTTAEMETRSTFTIEGGWDFIGETINGTEDIWWILEERDYPRLWWQLPVEDFNDGEPEPLWFVYEMEPDLAWLEEINSRLEINTTGAMEDVDAIYVSDSWQLDANESFAIQVDFHFSKIGVGDGRLTLGIVPTLEEPVEQWAQFEAGAFDDYPFYLYEVRDGHWVEELVCERFMDDGILYMSYNPNSDELYFSDSGYGKDNAIWTVTGLVRDKWQAESIYITIGGGSEDGMALTGEDAWLDNFAVKEGIIRQ